MDPKLNGTCDIPEGLRIARQFLGEVLDMGIPTATELLDPITPQYIADSLCWSAIGARTSESQTHRQMASGLSMPIGFKNATAGDVKAAVNGIIAATMSQTFLGITEDGRASAVTTEGNPDCQLILRGGTNGPNYQAEHVLRLKMHFVPQTHLSSLWLIVVMPTVKRSCPPTCCAGRCAWSNSKRGRFNSCCND
jgi:3-deoxy-7-phosphoheptulonate synthase